MKTQNSCKQKSNFFLLSCHSNSCDQYWMGQEGGGVSIISSPIYFVRKDPP